MKFLLQILSRHAMFILTEKSTSRRTLDSFAFTQRKTANTPSQLIWLSAIYQWMRTKTNDEQLIITLSTWSESLASNACAMANAVGVFNRFPLISNSSRELFCLIHSAKIKPPSGPKPFIFRLHRLSRTFSWMIDHWEKKSKEKMRTYFDSMGYVNRTSSSNIIPT